jgi:hypothetical protein
MPRRLAARAGQVGIVGQQLRASVCASAISAGLPLQIRHPKPRQARLRRADQIPRPPHRQIFLGDAKPVFGVADRGQPPRAGFVQRA